MASGRPERIVSELACPVFFVGFMGAGKTSVARKLARICGVASVDMDMYLERHEGKRVKELFSEVGESGFRDVETKILHILSEKDPLLVSCGGGVVLRPENRNLLKARGFVVYLQVTADEASLRISDTSTRPLFQNLDEARAMIQDRLALYEESANVVVDTAGKNVPTISYEVRALLEKEDILWRRK